MALNIGIFFGGKSTEHEVSLQSAQSIYKTIDKEKYKVWLIAIDKSGNWFLVNNTDFLENGNDPDKIKLKVSEKQKIAIYPDNGSNTILNLDTKQKIGHLDVAFPIIHGSLGEDGALQGFFNIINLPFVGADVLGSAIGMDKDIAKKLMNEANIANAPFLMFRKEEYASISLSDIIEKFGFPLFIKPATLGSSVGVNKANNTQQLNEAIITAFKFDNKIIIEKAIVGREIECSVLGNDELIASIPGEVIPKHEFYSYEAKYIDSQGASLEIPAKLPENIIKEVQKTAKNVFKVLQCFGLARVDVFVTVQGEIYVNEINTLPGFTQISMYPKLLDISGISFSHLIDKLIDLALERFKAKNSLLTDYK